MSALWPLWVFLAVVAVGIAGGALWRHRRADPGPYTKCDGFDLDADGVAHTCTVLVGRRLAHRVAVVDEFAEDGIVGAVGNLGVYCGRHCPGSCANPHCRLVRHGESL